MIVKCFFIILKAMTYILYTNDAQATTTNSTEKGMLAYTEVLSQHYNSCRYMFLFK